MKLDYKLIGTGWAECTIVVDNNSCTVTASYLSDSLKDFVEAVCSLLRGNPASRFSFEEEPGEYRWILNTEPVEEVKITIVEFTDLWDDKPDSEGMIVFQAKVGIHDFATALKAALDRILNEHGLSGYKKKWIEHDFPANEYQKLCSLLNLDTAI